MGGGDLGKLGVGHLHQELPFLNMPEVLQDHQTFLEHYKIPFFLFPTIEIDGPLQIVK